ncbi:ChbG/HpnK family deacetylase [Kaistia adipata]|uniref:ChbG/HpnK family deacetylase n=1 Tax=Kaistia adipata TaxID=166954 RepID=UPI0004014369|nr:ChbG/HpnK family deacetylase [Kaistia adipata]
MMTAGRVLLCADDYALSPGVSRGIAELIEAGRLSATGAMTTEPGWLQAREAVAGLRRQAAIGLHLNLTTGAPLGAMPRTLPLGRFDGIGAMMRRTRDGSADAGEITSEIDRQLDRFEAIAGAPPDFVDGHHHVHVLPLVRPALLAALARRYRHAPPLVRDPGDNPLRILARRRSLVKALGVAWLARGLAAEARRLGLPTNDGFSGFSRFDRAVPFDREMTDFLRAPGPRQLVMCHPGYPDEILRPLDPLFERRRDELDALKAFPAERILRLERDGSGRIRWPA